MKIRDISSKGENLLEQGENLNQRKSACLSQVASARSALMAARANYEYALSQKDEQGNPTGDIAGARARLSVAEASLDSAQRSLAAVDSQIEQVNREKTDTIREIERYTSGERKNLSIAEQLTSKRFGGHAAALAADLAARMNAGEEMKDKLLQSMGQSAQGVRFNVGWVSASGANISSIGKRERLQNDNSNVGAIKQYRTQNPRQKAAYDLYRKDMQAALQASQGDLSKLASYQNAIDQKYYMLAAREGWIKTDAPVNTLKNIGIALPDNLHMTQEYGNVLLNRFAAGIEVSKTVMEKFASKLEVVDDNLNVRGVPAHFTPISGFSYQRYNDGSEFVQYEKRGVHLNAVDDAKNKRGAGTTFFHEFGHMLDETVFSDGTTMSGDAAFQEALLSDAREFISHYESLSYEKKEQFQRWLYLDEQHSVSDLLGGLTGGRVEGRYGHSKEYWARSDKPIFKEAIAHFYEASMGARNKQESFLTLFPRAQTRFYEMLELAAEDSPTVLKRVLKPR